MSICWWIFPTLFSLKLHVPLCTRDKETKALSRCSDSNDTPGPPMEEEDPPWSTTPLFVFTSLRLLFCLLLCSVTLWLRRPECDTKHTTKGHFSVFSPVYQFIFSHVNFCLFFLLVSSTPLNFCLEYLKSFVSVFVPQEAKKKYDKETEKYCAVLEKHLSLSARKKESHLHEVCVDVWEHPSSTLLIISDIYLNFFWTVFLLTSSIWVAGGQPGR